MSINLKIEKKDLWLLSAIIVFLLGVVYVVAYGGTQPIVMGHSINEIERCAEGKILKVSGGLWVCSDDNAGAGGSYTAGEGINIASNTISIKSPTSTTKGGVKTASCSTGQAIRQIDTNGNAVCSTVPSATCSFGTNTYSIGATCAIGTCSNSQCTYQICTTGGGWAGPYTATCTGFTSGCPYVLC